MAELDFYRVKYCRTKSKTDYLSFNSLEMNFKDIDYLQKLMQRFFYERYKLTISIEETKFEKFIKLKYDVQYFKIDFLYAHIVKKTKIVKSYNDIIKVYWNRRLESVENIFTDSGVMTFNHQHIYVIYDTYNTFFMAAIFY